jgi:hypothetical protein
MTSSRFSELFTQRSTYPYKIRPWSLFRDKIQLRINIDKCTEAYINLKQLSIQAAMLLVLIPAVCAGGMID